MQQTVFAKRSFLATWAAATLLKVALALHLPLFVDEAFYWQESRHPAWAYSDLPGFTAALVRLGEAVAGHGLLGVRWPFLLIAAWLPWRIVAIARREVGGDVDGNLAFAWQAGTLAALLPLLGTLGLLALPDVPLALATVLCLDAGARLLREVRWSSIALLATGLAIGGLTHYRFVAVIGVGFVALLLAPEGRRALRDARVWLALAIGALAWWPLLQWNLDNADAGLRFQLVDRHPWAFHPDGIAFVAVQALFVTPLLLWALLRAGVANRGTAPAPGVRYLARSGLLVLLGFFVLGFFADSERVSFHWPLPAYLALLPLVPATLARWPAFARRATWAVAAFGLVASLGYYLVAATPSLRARLADRQVYPANFAGWDALADAVAARRATMPAGTTLLADDFKIGAELGFLFDDPRVPVLDHPLNVHHGRAPQLVLWGLHRDGRALREAAPQLLVVGATHVEFLRQLAHWHSLCERVGPLPPPTVLDVDGGRKRYLLFALEGPRVPGPCVAPAMAWIDAPEAGATVPRKFAMTGWAFKDGVGLASVEVLLDGRPFGRAGYGLSRPEVVGFWAKWRDGGSTDPQQPNVGFRADLDLAGVPPGRHRITLRLHGRDGSVEDWIEHPVVLE